MDALRILSVLVAVAITCILMIFIIRKNQRGSSFQYCLGDADEPNYPPRLLRQFLTRQEISKLLEHSHTQGFGTSLVGDDSKDTSVRRSETCWLDPSDHPWLDEIYVRVRSIPELMEDQTQNHVEYDFEPCQIVRYEPGGFYDEHYDQCYSNEPYCVRQVKQYGGPRKWTLIMYLTDDFDGGETYFTNLKHAVRPAAGDAILFNSLTLDNRFVHPMSLHQGCPVLQGQKYIANIWVRHRQEDKSAKMALRPQTANPKPRNP